MSRFDVTVLRSLAQLESLAGEWDVLSAPFGSPLLDHDWFACAAHAFHRESDLRVVVLRAQGRLAAVAPMAVDRSGHLVLIGSSVLHEPSGLLYESPDALRELLRTVIQMGQAVMLDRIPEGSLAPELFRPRGLSKAFTITRRVVGSNSVATNLPWNAYCATLSAPMRRKLAKARINAERERGPVRFTRIQPKPEGVGEALSQLVAVEASGWKARQGSALSTRPELLRFFKIYSERAAARNRLRVSTLTFDDTAVAVELGLEAYGRSWQLKVAYDEQFAAFVPGLQLIHASIGESAAARLDAFEFLGSAESWQERWRPQQHNYELAAIYPLRPAAMITALHDVTTHFSRRIQRAVRHQGVDA